MGIVPERLCTARNTRDPRLSARDLEKVFDHGVPGVRQIQAVIPAAPETQHPPVTEPVGKLGQLASSLAVGRR